MERCEVISGAIVGLINQNLFITEWHGWEWQQMGVDAIMLLFTFVCYFGFYSLEENK